MRSDTPVSAACALGIWLLSCSQAWGAPTGDKPDPWSSNQDINEGKLVFLEKPPAKPVHHHQNDFTIMRSSLDDGWIGILQCHRNLDYFPRTQILYNADRIRKLKIISTRGIGKAWLAGPSVQLLKVSKYASICVEAETRALQNLGGGRYILINGPFMRRFMDGFFPMRVSINIHLPRGLAFAGISPTPQKGFRVRHTSKSIHIDTWFEGRLFTRVSLRYSKNK